MSTSPVASPPPVARKRDHDGGQVEHRVHRQVELIKDGFQSGKLTKAEAKQLLGEERKVQEEAKDMQARDGGKLTAADRKQLNEDLNRIRQQALTYEAKPKAS